jgi:branched-chain amino acid transport system substrate-binding protein
VLYTRGMYAAMLAAEAAKTAQEIHGTAGHHAAMMRDGMEALEIMDAALMEALGMPGIGPEFAVSCADHGGSGMGRMQQWDADAGKWVVLTDFIESDKSM